MVARQRNTHRLGCNGALWQGCSSAQRARLPRRTPRTHLQAQTNSVKERIIFVQHMSLRMDMESVSRAFEKFGKLIKCEQLIPGKDMWMVQFANARVRPLAALLLRDWPLAVLAHDAVWIAPRRDTRGDAACARHT